MGFLSRVLGFGWPSLCLCASLDRGMTSLPGQRQGLSVCHWQTLTPLYNPAPLSSLLALALGRLARGTGRLVYPSWWCTVCMRSMVQVGEGRGRKGCRAREASRAS